MDYGDGPDRFFRRMLHEDFGKLSGVNNYAPKKKTPVKKSL